MKNIVIVLALADINNTDSFLINWWRSVNTSYAKSVVFALKSNKEINTKVLSSATKGGKLASEIATWGSKEVVNGIDFHNSNVVRNAIDGASGVFVITELNYELQDSLTDEVTKGRFIADSCRASNIPHVIYCSLVHVHAYIGLRSDVCDAKAHISDYMDKIELPKTNVYIPFLYENFIDGFMRPQTTDRPNIFKIAAPIGDIPIDMIASADVGECIKTLFENTNTWIGKTVALSGDKMSLQEYATQITDVTYPNIVRDGKVSPEEFLSIFDVTGSEDLANYFDYLTRSVQRNNQTTTMSLYPNIQSFYEWVRQYKDQINSLID